MTGFVLTDAMFVDGAAITGAGGLRGYGPNPAPPPAGPLTFDGSGWGRCSNTADSSVRAAGTPGIGFVALKLTTTMTNDIVLVTVATETDASNPTVSAITSGSGLTFVRVGGVAFLDTDGGHYLNIETWRARATAILSAEPITVLLTAACNNMATIAIAVNGCNLTTPVDVNANAVVTGTSTNPAGVPSVSLSTTHAACFLLFAACGEGLAKNSGPPSGFTAVFNYVTQGSGGSGSISQSASSKIVSSTQTNLALAPTTAAHFGSGACIGVALQGA